jgi:hypothetical protein
MPVRRLLHSLHDDATAQGWADDPPAARRTGAFALAGVALAEAALLWQGLRQRRLRREPSPRREVRDLHGAAAGLCASVLADSAVEHYRARFENPGMLAPLVSSAVALAAGASAARNGSAPSRWRRGGYAVAGVVGIAGLGFHAYNVARRPGGFGWLNLFYGAPVGAPAALALGGVIGLAAERLATQPVRGARLLGLPAGRVLSGLVALGLAGTVSEAALLHYRGSFHNPFMWLPVALPPVAALATASAAFGRASARPRTLTRLWLRLTAALGLAGVGFHAYGISRAMGGWRNWQQNVLDGPPLPAPPSFTALSIAGLAALRLRERDR